MTKLVRRLKRLRRRWSVPGWLVGAYGLLSFIWNQLLPAIQNIEWFYDKFRNVPVPSLGWSALLFVVGLVWLAVIALWPEKTTKAKNATAEEWKDLADRFKALPHAALVRADWLRSDNGEESWMIMGGKQEAKCQSLCRLAGALLMRSPNILRKLTTGVSTDLDLGCRWLYFLKDKYGLTPGSLVMSGSINGVPFQGGSIQNLPGVSESACLDCAAEAE